MLLFFITLYLLANIALGWWMLRRVNSASDFVNAGRDLPLFITSSTFFATWFGSETVLGTSSEFVQHGFLIIIEAPFGSALLLSLFVLHNLTVQNTLTGIVTDENDEALIGVSIAIQGTTSGTVSDFDGIFSLMSEQALPWNLAISYIGYATQNVVVNSLEEQVKIQLSEAPYQLNEVVVSTNKFKSTMKNTIQTIIALFIIIPIAIGTLSIRANAQVAINTDNSMPDASAMLDVKSSDKGMLVPRMTSSQRTVISNAATGLLVFDTTTESFWFKSSTVWIELVDNNSDVFQRDAGKSTIVPNSGKVNLATDDFVFGSPQLEDSGDSQHDKRFFFDKSKGAFRAGVEETNNWNDNNVGVASTAIGENNRASGANSIALGKGNTATAETAIAMGFESNASGKTAIAVGYQNMATEDTTLAIGNQNIADELYAIAVGSENSATAEGATAIGCINSATAQGASVFGEFSQANGIGSLALGSYVSANADGSVAVGTENIASGDFSQAYGSWTTTYSGFETVMGYFNTAYTPMSTDNFAPTDRLFVIGNGAPNAGSDALVMLKNGNTRINGLLTLGMSGSQPIDFSYTFPNLKGTSGQILQLNGNMMQWVDLPSPSLVTDGDNDTKIQVEESPDEDAIRFDIEGDELFRIGKNTNGGTLLSVSDANNNIYIGDSVATIDNSSATELPNTIIGNHSFKNNTSGAANVALGFRNLENNTIGFGNVALGGRHVLKENINGAANIAIGSRALRENTSGELNVSIGELSGLYNQQGSENVLIGAFTGVGAAFHNKSNNVMIGHEAGYNNTGDGNVFLGHRSGRNETASNKLYIENSLSSSPLIYGEFDNDLIRINGDLEVTGSFPGTDDQMLSFDGTNLSITDGNSVNISGISTNTDDQMLSFNSSNNTLSLEDGGSVNLSSIDTDTDEQTLSYNSTNNTLSISGGNAVTLASSTPDVPVGCIMMWYMNESTVPQDWLICDNRIYNTTTYPALFALLGTNRTPDFAGKFPIGPKDGIASPGDPIPESIVLRQAGGNQFITIKENNLPPHSHGVTIAYREGTENGSGNDYSDLGDTGSSTNYTTDDGGFANDPINILPPWRGVFFIIKAK